MKVVQTAVMSANKNVFKYMVVRRKRHEYEAALAAHEASVACVAR